MNTDRLNRLDCAQSQPLGSALQFWAAAVARTPRPVSIARRDRASGGTTAQGGSMVSDGSTGHGGNGGIAGAGGASSSSSGVSCLDSSGTIATRPRPAPCRAIAGSGPANCCGAISDVGMAKSSSCTFPTPSCENFACPSTLPAEQAEDGKDAARGLHRVECVSGQCMTSSWPVPDAGADAGPCPAGQIWCLGCTPERVAVRPGGCPGFACPYRTLERATLLREAAAR